MPVFNIKATAQRFAPGGYYNALLVCANPEVGALLPGYSYQQTFTTGTLDAANNVFPTIENALTYYFSQQGAGMVSDHNAYLATNGWSVVYTLGIMTMTDTLTYNEIESKEAITQVATDIATATGALKGSAPSNLDTLGEIDTQLSADEAALTANVLSTVLTGLNTGTATPALATDSVLVALGKIQAQITALKNTTAAIKQVKFVTLPTGSSGNNVVLANGTFTMNFATLSPSLSFTKTPFIVPFIQSPSGLAAAVASITASSTTSVTGQVNDPVGTILISGSPLQALQAPITFMLVEPV